MNKGCYCDDAIVQCQEACKYIINKPLHGCHAIQSKLGSRKRLPCCEMWDCRETNDCSVLPTRLKTLKLILLTPLIFNQVFVIPAVIGTYEGFLQIQYLAGFFGTRIHSSWPRKKFTFFGWRIPGWRALWSISWSCCS